MIDLNQLIEQLDETKNLNNDYDRFIAIKDRLSISTLQRIFKLSYPKAKVIIDDLVECRAIEKETYKLLSLQKYNEYLRQHSIVKYKGVDDFMPYMIDFIKNYLIFDICYVKRLDKVLDTKLSEMPFEDRKEKFAFMIQSEAKAVLSLYFTYSYLADMYKHSGRMEIKQEETKIPLIEDMFKD